MGVSGSGKTSLGRALAARLGWEFIDADDFHPAGNIVKMESGIPLTDSDREPWLDALHRRLVYSLQSGGHPILACSALRESYRARLLHGLDGIAVIYLKGSYDLIQARMTSRQDHFMRPEMLRSQFEVLEPPADAVVLDVRKPVDELVGIVLRLFERYA